MGIGVLLIFFALGILLTLNTKENLNRLNAEKDRKVNKG